MLIVPVKQGSEEWLELRKTKVSATDCCIIMRESPFVSPHQLWLKKIGVLPEEPLNDAMREGMALEEPARQFFQELTGIEVEPIVGIHRNYPWMMASFDGYNQEKGICLEIKCGKKSFAQAKKGIIPQYYYSQIQHQLEVTPDFQEGNYLCFNGKDGILMKIKRDEAYIRKLITAENRFYECLVNFVSPVTYNEAENEECYPIRAAPL